MSHRPLSMSRFAGWLTALALGATSLAAHAQASAPLPELPAAPRALSPADRASAAAGPRVRSPAEQAKNATMPGDLRPERPVTPQLSIPFGKVAPPAPKRDTPARPTSLGGSPGGVDDAVARCEAQIDAGLRAECRARLARQGTPPKPAP